ncbi:transposase, partial [Mycolicibacterium pyrenivorans]|uniref:transposase n=1 Tax=Mycolicibacterium pyrenivorans TaxID=187102 RepID=UPI00355917A1
QPSAKSTSRTPSTPQTSRSQPCPTAGLQITTESLNAPYRRAIRARGHFPTEQAAMKCLYLVTRSLDPTGRGKARWAMRWKPALNAFAITFNGRITPTGN